MYNATPSHIRSQVWQLLILGERLMSAIFELSAAARKDVGKGASRRLRRDQGLVPAIIYGGEQPAQTVTLPHKDVLKALQHEAFYSHILTVTVDNTPEKVVLKDLHRHPVKPIILHMDFQRVSSKQKLHMHVPIHFINEELAPGVKEGGVFSHSMKEVEIVCLPADLPEYIEVDMGNLELNQNVHLSDVKAPKGVEFVAIEHDEDPAIASIHMPKVVEEETIVEEEVLEGEEAEAAEGETSEEGDDKAEASKDKPEE